MSNKFTSLKGMNDGVYIIQQGSIIVTLKPKEFGHDSIQWQHGKVFEVSESKRIRVKNIKQ